MGISGSSTIEVVGAGYFGSTVNVTGAISGSSTLSAVGAITTAGGLDLQGTGITNVGSIGGLTNISGSGTFQAVGAATFGTTVAATGSISGSSTLSCVGAITTAGGLNLQNTGISNAGALAGVTTISASSTLEAVGNTFLGGTLNVTGATTFANTVKIVDDKTLIFGSDDNVTMEYDEDGTDALLVTGDSFTFTSANQDDPLIIIKNTTNHANGARLRFVKDKGAAGAANDVAGIIEFYADDANQDQVLFSEIKSQVAVHTNGQEGGKLTISVASHDGESQPGIIITDGSAEDEVDVTIGNGNDSLVTISGDLDLPNGGFALGSDADGDIYYRNSGNLQRLAVGSNSQVLTLNSGLPSWQDAAAGNTFTDLSGSGTFQAVGNSFFGATVSVTGAVSLAAGDGALQFTKAGENSIKIPDNQGSALVIEEANNAYMTFDTTNSSERIKLSQHTTIIDDKKLYFGTGEDWSIEYDEDGDDALKMAGTTFEMNADTVTFTAETSTDPLVIIKNYTNDANGARLRFVKDKGAAGAANDVAGIIEFYADDANQDQVKFSEIKSQVKVHTNGQEGGKLTISVAEHDGTSTAGLVIEDGDADGELDVTIGAGADSLTTIAGDLDLPNGGFALGSDADGDIYYRNSGNLQRLAKGSDGEVLTLASGIPSWAASSAGSTFTNLSGSGTLQAVGAVTFGNTLNVSGNATLAGTTIAQGVTFTNASGSGTLEVVGNAFYNADVRASGSVLATTSLKTPLIEFTDGDDAITIGDGGTVTFSNTVKLVDDKTLIFGSNDDWTIEYDENGDDDLVMTGTTLTVATDTASFESANANDPLVQIKNTTNDADGARLRFVKDKGAAGAANDVAGIIEFYADDANQDQVKFSEIKSQVKVHTNGQEGGKLTISVAEHDGTSTAGLVIQDGDADGELDVTIGAGAASVVSAPGFLSGAVGLKGLALTVGGAGNRGFDEDAQISCNGINVNNGGISNVGALAGVTNLSGSGTLQAVGNAFMGAALNVTGNATINGSSTLQGVTFTNASGSGTLEVVGHAFYNADVRASGSVLATTSLKTPLIEYTDGDDAITIGDGGTVTFSNTVKLVDDKTLTFGSNDDWTIEYDEDGDDDLVMTGTTLTIATDTASFESANANDPLVQIKNTTNDANGAILRFVKDKGAAGAANDVNGKIQFYGDDANQDQVLFSEIESQVAVHTNGQEGGRLSLKVASNDGELVDGLIIEDGAAEDQVYVKIKDNDKLIFGTNSDISIAYAETSTAVGTNDSLVIQTAERINFEYDMASAAPLTAPFATDGDTNGTIIKFSPGADDDLTVGQLYYLHTDGTWNQADASAASTSKQMLGIGLGNARSIGVLINGFVRIPGTEILNIPGSNASAGLPLYVSTTAGHIDFTAPSGNGEIVRIIGYAIQDDTDVLIYFDPDATYVEITA